MLGIQNFWVFYHAQIMSLMAKLNFRLFCYLTWWWYTSYLSWGSRWGLQSFPPPTMTSRCFQSFIGSSWSLLFSSLLKKLDFSTHISLLTIQRFYQVIFSKWSIIPKLLHTFDSVVQAYSQEASWMDLSSWSDCPICPPHRAHIFKHAATVIRTSHLWESHWNRVRIPRGAINLLRLKSELGTIYFKRDYFHCTTLLLFIPVLFKMVGIFKKRLSRMS